MLPVRTPPSSNAKLASAWRAIPFKWVLLFAAGAFAGFQANTSNRALRFAEFLKARYVSATTLDVREPELLQLHVSFANISKLSQVRQEALSQGSLSYIDNEYVKARIDCEGKEHKAELRLKGDRLEHIKGDKGWSFRVKIRGDDTLLGMKRFSLHKPELRNGLYEWIFHTLLRDEGLISLRYVFVRVHVNGDDWGIYALEEQFDKRLIEHNRRREGPILRFPDSNLWAGTHHTRDAYTSPVDVYEKDKWAQPENVPLRDKAVSLLTSFLRGETSLEQAFDIDQLGRYFALCDTLGAVHGALLKSIKFYFNPVTSRLEPIGFDGHVSEDFQLPITTPEIGKNPDAIWFDKAYIHWFALCFDDGNPSFIKAYVTHLDRLAGDSYLKDFFAKHLKEYQRQYDILRLEYGNGHSADLRSGIASTDPTLVTQREHVRGLINTNPYYVLVNSFLREQSSSSAWIQIMATHVLPLTVTGLLDEAGNKYPVEPPIAIPGKSYGHIPDIVEFNVPVKKQGEMPTLTSILVRFPGLSKEHLSPLMAHPLRILSTLTDPMHLADTDLARIEGLVLDGDNIVFPKRLVQLGASLSIPAGKQVHLPAGCHITLSSNASIISRSPIFAHGTPEQPVIIESQDGTGGLFVLQTTESRLTHTHFKGLGTPSGNGWSLTGAVTFYEANVIFSSCRFAGARCEDSLNIIRSQFEIYDCQFTGSTGDALDADFSSGVISESLFLDNANDAIDVSGTQATIRQVVISGSGDKGISAGEASNVTANKVTISHSHTGAASKDRSRLVVRNTTITDCHVGLAAYKKKPEFGGGHLQASGVTVTGCSHTHARDDESLIWHDGQHPAALPAREVVRLTDPAAKP